MEDNNSYCFRDTLFSGLVVYRNMNGLTLCVWKYERGKAVQFLKPTGRSTIATKSDWYCETTTTIEWTEWTYNNSDRKDISGLSISENTECWEVYTGTQEMTNWIDRSPGGGGDPLAEGEWWENGHNAIMDAALSKFINSNKSGQVKLGSKNADTDPYQELKYSYMHAMLQPGQTYEQGIEAMRGYFRKYVREFLNSRDYVALGMALHCIQDAYSPAHEFQYWTGGVWAWIPHLFENITTYPREFFQAVDGTRWIYESIIAGDSSDDRINSIFDTWLWRFKNN